MTGIMIKGTGHNELEVQNYKEFIENCGNETFYRTMEKRDMEQFHEVFAGVRNISTKS